MAKQTITQRSFRLGELTEGFLEADGTELRQLSVRRGRNVRVTVSDTLTSRPGSWFVRDGAGASDIIELRFDTNTVYGLVIAGTTMRVIDQNGDTLAFFNTVPWTDESHAWVEGFRERTIIGGDAGLYILTFLDPGWTFAPISFDVTTGNQLAQPYWAFQKDISIRPSARTGNINVNSSGGIFRAGHVGTRIRYGRREILVTEFVSGTLVRGTVINTLPPCFKITVASTAGIEAGDAIVGQTTNYQGLVISVSGNDLYVVTVDFFDGPDVGEKISSPSSSSEVTAKEECDPLMSPIWDEQLISPVRGYPKAGASASGRMTLIDFPQVPDLICMSSSRNITDFETGDEDDDAIVRQAGDNSPRFMHVVNAGDLLLFSDRGLYFVSIREGGALTPLNFNVILFDRRASSEIKPVPVDDGVVFVEASRKAIAAAVLSGNVYLKWSVRTISSYHNHLITDPVKLCGPSLFSGAPEKYLFVVNADGTLAVVSWIADFGLDSVGFVSWNTEGEYVSVSPIFGAYWAIVDRTVNGSVSRFIERFDNDAYLDCQVPLQESDVLVTSGFDLEVNGDTLEILSSAATTFAGETLHVYGAGWYSGTVDVGLDGSVPGIENFPIPSYGGFNFVPSVMPWPVEFINSPRAGMLKARLIRVSTSVRSTTAFSIRTNSNTRRLGGYTAGDDVTLPPEPRTQVYVSSVVGRRDHPEIEITRQEPGPFEVLAVTQEVQV